MSLLLLVFMAVCTLAGIWFSIHAWYEIDQDAVDVPEDVLEIPTASGLQDWYEGAPQDCQVPYEQR